VAESRADVDALHGLLTERGITVLDEPAEYDYASGYYAVFFADPDGMKFEFVHMPAPGEEA
jgi:glyoxylase I family protein